MVIVPYGFISQSALSDGQGLFIKKKLQVMFFFHMAFVAPLIRGETTVNSAARQISRSRIVHNWVYITGVDIYLFVSFFCSPSTCRGKLQ